MGGMAVVSWTPLPTAALSTSALHLQRKPRHPITPANSWAGRFSAPCKKRREKLTSQQGEEQQPHATLWRSQICFRLSPPRPRLHVAGWKSRDAAREVFILIYLVMEEWQALKEQYQQLEQATGSCPKLQAWKQAACHRHKARAWFPMWDKRELITGLLPFNENEQRFEIQHTKGPNISVPLPPALAKTNTTSIFCNKSWSAFPALPGLGQGNQRAPNQDGLHPTCQAWSASSLSLCGCLSSYGTRHGCSQRKTKAWPVRCEQGPSGH